MPLRTTAATELLIPAFRELQRRAGAQVLGTIETSLRSRHAMLVDCCSPLCDASNGTQRIPHEAMIELLDKGVRLSGDPAFGLHAGARARRGDFGIYDLLVLSAPTLRVAASLAVKYLPLLHDGCEVELVEHGEQAIWTHRVQPGLAGSAVCNDYAVAAFCFGARRGVGLDVPVEVRFMHAAPAYRAQYRRLFGAKVRFEADTNAVSFSRRALDRPMCGSDPPLHAVLCRYADDLLERLPTLSPFSRRIAGLIRHRLEGGATLTDLAEALHMSESTVQRKLQSEGTTHTELLDNVRREVAAELLGKTDLHINEVAYRLGFAHRPAFNRAFKRWFGHSPSEHRAHVIGPPAIAIEPRSNRQHSRAS